MSKLIPRTLFGQLLLGILVVQAAFLTGFLSYTIVSQRDTAKVHTRLRMDMQLDRIAAACSKLLAKGDLASVPDALELSRVATAIEVVRLTDLTGKTLAVTTNSYHELDEEEEALLGGTPARHIYQIKNGQWEAVTPVMVQGKPVALLWLEPNHAGSLNTMSVLARISLTYGLAALLINVLPIFLIVRMTTTPLSKLRGATQYVIQHPELGGVFPLPVTVANEAGELTASFNAMVKKLEDQRGGLLEALALLDSLLGNAPIGFGFFDAELHCVRANQVLADMCGEETGIDPERKPTELTSNAWATQTELQVAQVFKNGEAVRNVEITCESEEAGGKPRSWLMHFYPVWSGEMVWRVGTIAIEITERLQAEEMLRKTEKLAATGRLAASIAHEINNPLEAVTNLLYLLRTHETLDEPAIEFVATAQAELERVAEITQQTLRFYRQSTSPSETKVADMLDSVVKLYQSRINAAHVVVQRRFRGQPEVFGFSGELRQVFANFIGNALDAMPRGGQLILRARVGSGRESNGDFSSGVRISVTDTGTGMSAETLKRAFEAFFTTKHATGTGLGLWLSEEIIRKHSGSVRVKSRTGAKSGTMFVVFFPDRGAGKSEVDSSAASANSLFIN